MLVVSDASPLNILIRLGLEDVLASLFASVAVPASVAEEMSRPSTPRSVRDWVAHPPRWFSVRVPMSPVADPSLRHRGESDAICLARELRADAILLDEDKPRKQATRLGLRVIGTVGVLEQAANRGFVSDLKAVHDQLRATDFFVSEEILEDSLARHLAVVRANVARPAGGECRGEELS